MSHPSTFRTSPLQRRIWSRETRLNRALRSELVIRVEGAFDEDRFAGALHAVVSVQEILRTRIETFESFRWPVQSVGEAWDPVEWEARSTGATTRELRLALPTACADVPTLLILYHLLARAYREGVDRVRTQGAQYAQYSEWQLESGKVLEPGEGVALRADHTPLPWEAPTTGMEPDDHRAVTVRLEPRWLRNLEGRGVQPRGALLSAWLVTLGRFADRTRVRCAVFDDGRVFPELAEVLGPMGRYLPIEADLAASRTFASLAQSLEEDLGLERLAQADGVTGPVDLVGFEFFNLPSPTPVGEARWVLGSARGDVEWFKVRLRCWGGPDGVAAEILFDPDRVNAGCAQSLAATVAAIVRSAANAPEALLGTLTLVNPPDIPPAERIVPRARLRDETFLERFFRQTATKPCAVAAEGDGKSVSFAELEERVRQVSGRLRRHGVGPEIPVAVYAEPSVEQLIAALAVMLAGGVYVPIALTDPPARIEVVLEEAGIRLLLAADLNTLPPFRTPLEREAIEDGGGSPRPYLGAPPVTGDNLAYCIFTSGSTGRPKGVGVPHLALRHYLDWAARVYLGGRFQSALVHTAVNVDLTLTALLTPLVAGGTVVFTPPGHRIDRLAEALRKNPGTGLLKLTPAHLRALSNGRDGSRDGCDVENLVVGGEMLDLADVSSWRRANPRTQVFNEYGPTETTVGCCVERVSADAGETGLALIGRPIDGVVIRILNEWQEQLPVGVIGELYIGGPGLARGYVGRPSETAARFVPDPLGGEGDRLHRSGDLARMLPDGRLELLGRRDGQVKVRGYRVDIAEVESALRSHPSVLNAAVLPMGPRGNTHLWAAVVLRGGAAVAEEELRTHLAVSLPEYMIPSVITTLEHLPQTSGGKVDRQAHRQAEPRRDRPRPSGDRRRRSARGDLVGRAGSPRSRCQRQLLRGRRRLDPDDPGGVPGRGARPRPHGRRRLRGTDDSWAGAPGRETSRHPIRSHGPVLAHRLRRAHHPPGRRSRRLPRQHRPAGHALSQRARAGYGDLP